MQFIWHHIDVVEKTVQLPASTVQIATK